MEINEILQTNIMDLEKIALDNGITLQDNATKTDILSKVLPCILNKQTVISLLQFSKRQHINVDKSLTKIELVKFITNEICKKTCDSVKSEISSSDFINLKYGRTCVCQTREPSTIRAYMICPCCGEELYGIFSEETEEKKILSNFKKCPNCKNKISFNGNGRIECKDKLNVNKVFNEIRANMEINERVFYEKKCDDYIDKLCKTQSHLTNACTLTSVSIDELKQYLLHLINIESEIYLTKEYLTTLQVKIENNEKQFYRAKCILNSKITEYNSAKVFDITGEIERLEDQINKPEKYVNILFEEIPLTIIEPNQPPKPKKVKFKKPVKPIEPTYKTAFFFNRKKIQLANEQLKAEYEKSLATYSIELQKYNEAQKQYEIDLLKYDSEQKQYTQDFNKYLIEKKNAIDNYINERRNEFVQNRKSILDKKIKERDLLLNSTDAAVLYESQLPQNYVKQFLLNEQKYIMNELRKLVETRNELYDRNLIYGKYRNYTTLTTLYEYLVSARCNSLEGANGAYNLYESELHSNEIINQLSKIVTSLDSIKANQFMLYQELRKTNDILSNLSDSVDSAVYELRCCNSSLQEVGNTMNFVAVNSLITAAAAVETAKNSSVTAHNSAVIAHNSAISAHYSKVNADMTCALGFARALGK